jgi:DNA-binding CsgD family transcriptional regulator
MPVEAEAECHESSALSATPTARFNLSGVPCCVIAKDGVRDSRFLIGEVRLFGRSFGVVLDPRVACQPHHLDARGSKLGRLTRREREIALLVAQGYLTKQIAHELGLSPHTVTAYVNRIFAKLDVHNRAEMVASVLLDAKAPSA